MVDKADYPISVENHHCPLNYLILVEPVEERSWDFGGTAIFLLLQESGQAFYSATDFHVILHKTCRMKADVFADLV